MDGKTLKEAWHCLEWLYLRAEERVPKPRYKYMDLKMKERKELYQKVSPTEEPIPINVEPFDINDETPEDVDIRTVVKGT